MQVRSLELRFTSLLKGYQYTSIFSLQMFVDGMSISLDYNQGQSKAEGRQTAERYDASVSLVFVA